MALALIDDLSDATAALRQAMKDVDLGAMEASTARFRASLEAVQGVDAWRAAPQLKAQIKALLEELESSRMLACLLADVTGQKHMDAASRNADAPQALYQRPR